MCHKRAYRTAHPIQDAWHHLHNHAKERRIEVGLKFPIFENFCLQTGYYERRGNEAESLTIDRFDAALGYEATNIQILTRSENSRKGAREKPAARRRFTMTSADAWRAAP